MWCHRQFVESPKDIFRKKRILYACTRWKTKGHFFKKMRSRRGPGGSRRRQKSFQKAFKISLKQKASFVVVFYMIFINFNIKKITKKSNSAFFCFHIKNHYFHIEMPFWLTKRSILSHKNDLFLLQQAPLSFLVVFLTKTSVVGSTGSIRYSCFSYSK